MLRVIFDTTIYGFIAKESKLRREQIIKELKMDKNFNVYGFNEIRREIKRVEKWINQNLVKDILKIYGFLVYKEYSNDKKIEYLAKEYFKEYRYLKGKKQWKELRVDFLIVACASIKNIDILYSGDRESMSRDSKWSKTCTEAYKNVNIKHDFRLPTFWKYCELKRKAGLYK